MALTYQETKIIKETIPVLQDHGEELATIFYKTMLTDRPDLNNYFNTVNQLNGRQPKALTSLILHYANNISFISEIVPKLEKVCQKHCSLGIQPEHYEIVGKYLIGAFGQILGAAMTQKVHDAWTKAYWTLARMMIGREVQLYKDFAKWTDYRKFKVTHKVEETDDIVSFHLAPVDGKSLPDFMPGQYVTVQVHVPEVGYLQSRQYALSDAPRPDHYRISIKRDQGSPFTNSVSTAYFNPGLVSNYLIDSISAGDMLDVSHPAGEFYLDTNNGSSVPIVLLSAGVGMAPLMSILNTVALTQPSRSVSWIHGAKRQVPFEHHLDYLGKQMPNLRKKLFTTDIAAAPLAGVQKDKKFDVRVDLAQVEREDLFLGHGGTEYYICGPEQFMLEMNEYLKDLGIQDSRIKFGLLSTGDLAFKRDAR